MQPIILDNTTIRWWTVVLYATLCLAATAATYAVMYALYCYPLGMLVLAVPGIWWEVRHRWAGQ